MVIMTGTEEEVRRHRATEVHMSQAHPGWYVYLTRPKHTGVKPIVVLVELPAARDGSCGDGQARTLTVHLKRNVVVAAQKRKCCFSIWYQKWRCTAYH